MSLIQRAIKKRAEKVIIISAVDKINRQPARSNTGTQNVIKAFHVRSWGAGFKESQKNTKTIEFVSAINAPILQISA